MDNSFVWSSLPTSPKAGQEGFPPPATLFSPLHWAQSKPGAQPALGRSRGSGGAASQPGRGSAGWAAGVTSSTPLPSFSTNPCYFFFSPLQVSKPWRAEPKQPGCPKSPVGARFLTHPHRRVLGGGQRLSPEGCRSADEVVPLPLLGRGRRAELLQPPWSTLPVQWGAQSESAASDRSMFLSRYPHLRTRALTV